jgi:hypothetical protein
LWAKVSDHYQAVRHGEEVPSEQEVKLENMVGALDLVQGEVAHTSALVTGTTGNPFPIQTFWQATMKLASIDDSTRVTITGRVGN